MTDSAPAKSSKISAPVKVLIALVLAAIVGLSLTAYDQSLALKIADVLRPIGRLWLNALQMTVVPLVTALVIVGVNTYSASLNIKRTRHIYIQSSFVCFALFAFCVLSVQMLHKPGDRIVVTSLRQNLRAGRRSCCRRCSPTLCHS